MNLRRWQLVWTLLIVLWLGGWASPMVLLLRSGDSEQLSIYFGMWVAVVLLPTMVVYLVALLVGMSVISTRGTAANTPPTGRKRVWPFGTLVWALLVGIFCIAAPGSLNPFTRFAMPLAVAVALLMVMLPPLLLYAAGSALSRIRPRVRNG